LDIDTCVCQSFASLFRFRKLGMTLIVAMSMEQYFVTQVVVVAVAVNVVHFQDVSVLKVQFQY
jgi:hypothetical protein